MAANLPPAPHGYRLSVKLAQGDTAGAQRLLDALNQVRAAFDAPPFDMPPPHGPMEGLEWCAAGLVEVEQLEPRDGRERVL